ncbi:hypothetical protein RFH95_00465 [Acinetobacter nosocomialis]|uniref:DUF6602 domain-containing protein n=2 Tax=Acinetobacter nosocomialis TaxID=106654 RepID=A0A2L1VGM9_ACINO|nr:DUF6602 domain-containing protein [Acinetobacter nosocomialis]AVF44226.1 hypothetical protein AL533_07435 [Acinetobacter nosocomialis]MBD0443595.1 hypothetical protein [Acinetobacter nosocomialis]MBP1502830.1 hypothetical protein [Acinetobacter nosocomialis]MBR7688219.1 hypothetical protein [Acinetobacter nosocomialis]MBR7702926.1 hypothetical protein [Acinetobacter nosocomialis]
MSSNSSNQINKLFRAKIENFKTSFINNSRNLYTKDKDEGLIHPSEFGLYREELVKEYLKNILPDRMEIGSGFVVTANGLISTQCDIIIYDKTVTPLIKNEKNQRFFPIESVVAIGEVKSKLTLSDLKDALLKLAKSKGLRDVLYSPAYVYSIRNKKSTDDYKPENDEFDQIVTFLICEKFLFPIEDTPLTNIIRCYGDSLPHRPFCHRHNMVLSIEDGLLTYVLDGYTIYPFPSKLTSIFKFDEENNITEEIKKVERLNYRFIKPINKESIEHIRHFTSILHTGLISVSVLFPDLARYIPDEEDVQMFDCVQNYKF